MIINRYFLKSIFSYTLTISLIFILIIVPSRSIQYLEQAARGEINPEIVFLVVLLRFPEFLELILPLSFFLSIILSLGKYRADSEFVIMEQLGFSLGKLNYLINAFMQKGLVKIKNFQNNPKKSNYLYILTKKGLTEKTKLTIHFMERKMKEYDELKKEIDQTKDN